MRKDRSGRGESPVDEAPRGTSILARRGLLTIAGTLKLACVLVLVGFVAFMFASYLSLRSIDKSFSEVAKVDQPSVVPI